MKKLLIAGFAAMALSACDTNKTTETTTTIETDTAIQTTDPATGADTMATDTTGGAAGGSTLSLMSFMTQAADGNMAEVAHGRLAAQKAADAEVKKYGQMMTTDHTTASAEMKRLAAKNNITLPDTMSQVHQDMHKQLAKLSGSDFDKMYMSHMVAEHEKTVSLFTMGSQSAQDPEVRAFAQKTLPTLQAHLDQARKINSRISGAK